MALHAASQPRYVRSCRRCPECLKRAPLSLLSSLLRTCALAERLRCHDGARWNTHTHTRARARASKHMIPTCEVCGCICSFGASSSHLLPTQLRAASVFLHVGVFACVFVFVCVCLRLRVHACACYVGAAAQYSALLALEGDRMLVIWEDHPTQRSAIINTTWCGCLHPSTATTTTTTTTN